jgi:TRAP transporter TAXI family solute receptor
VVAFQFIKPAPPDRVVMATGNPQGAYHAFATAYAEHLAAEGIELQLVNTAGSVENLDLLRQGLVDVAMVQGGVSATQAGEELHSLGSLYYEPLWLFARAGLDVDRIPRLAGKRVAIGAQGSGTQALVSRLLQDNGLDAGAADLVTLAGDEAAAALLEGRVDAAFFVSSAQSGLVSRLLRAQEVAPASFERAAAYARRYRFLTSLQLPEGAVDLQRNIPARPVQLLAPAANLVIDAQLHPAVIDLLLQAAEAEHADGGWFEAPGEFPQAGLLAYPLAGEARRFYKHGPPLLQRFLPFWAASLIDRLKVMLLPLVLMLLPLVRVMPPIYTWRMRARVYRWYDELERVDSQLASGDTVDRDALAAELDRIETDVREVRVPLSFAHQLYHLRQHIALVRQDLSSRA